MCFSPDGKQLASCGNDRTVRYELVPSVGLLDVETGACVKTLEGHDDSVLSVCFSPDGQTLASGSKEPTLRLWLVV